jgi:phage gp46-like protein
MAIAACSANFAERRRHFWTTQPNACGTVAECNMDCGRPGLLLTPVTSDPGTPRSFVTSDWVRGLLLNILGTDAKLPDRSCGYEAWQQGGHWSESYRNDGQKTGTLVRELKTGRSIKDSIAAVKAHLENDLSKLISMEIASSVVVNATYIGGNKVKVDIVVTSIAGVDAKVGLTGERSAISWVWN